MAGHNAGEVSPWVERWSHLIAPGTTVLDVACGGGRHLRWFAGRGCRVTGVDRDGLALAPLEGLGEIIVADIENASWPLPGRRFDAVIVTNYLWRELMPTLIASVSDGGVLIYETFAAGNEIVGKPSNPKFLLGRGELLSLAGDLRVIAFEDGFLDGPARFVQRLVAVREAHGQRSAGEPLPRYMLQTQTGCAGQVKSRDSEEPA